MPGKAKKGFQKGNKLAKGQGRPVLPPDIVAVRLWNREELERMINAYMNTSVGILKSYQEDAALPSKDLMVISMLIEAADGDINRAEFLLERSIGRVAQDLNLHASPHSVIMKLLEEGGSDGN